MGFAVSGHLFLPSALGLGALRTRIPAGIDFRRNHEWFVLPAKLDSCRRHLLLPQRGAVRLMVAGQMWRAVGDHRLTTDQAGFVLDRTGLLDRSDNLLGIVPIYAGDGVPAIGAKASRCVVGKPAIDVTVDRDVVVVVEQDQFP